MNRQCYLIAYDIADHRARRRACRLLRKVADCYQDSVFEVRLCRAELAELVDQLLPLMADTDSLLTLSLQGHRCTQLGTGMVPISGPLVVFH